ncbi:hypothetical protein [Pseudomonas sp. NPDC089569]|uniref:hypothetical protein n=1 Tax=Pseudomonas sp. NPDC089569 TaxID=3390722 RepID=UPI003D00F460
MIDLTFITGNVSHDDLSFLENGDLCSQVDCLKEDMLQVEYPSSLLLDVGWYPSFDPNGSFQVRVIKNYDWSQPVFFSRAISMPSLIVEISNAQAEIGKVFMAGNS